MAKLFRNNPIPTTGALYVTNPRRSIPTRDNGKMNRFIFEEIFGRRAQGGKRSADQTMIREMLFGTRRKSNPKTSGFTAAQAKKAQQLREAILSGKGAVYKRYLKFRDEATAGYKSMLERETGKKKTKKRNPRTISLRNNPTGSETAYLFYVLFGPDGIKDEDGKPLKPLYRDRVTREILEFPKRPKTEAQAMEMVKKQGAGEVVKFIKTKLKSSAVGAALKQIQKDFTTMKKLVKSGDEDMLSDVQEEYADFHKRFQDKYGEGRTPYQKKERWTADSGVSALDALRGARTRSMRFEDIDFDSPTTSTKKTASKPAKKQKSTGGSLVDRMRAKNSGSTAPAVAQMLTKDQLKLAKDVVDVADSRKQFLTEMIDLCEQMEEFEFLCELTSNQQRSLYDYLITIKSNPRRRNAMAIRMRNNPKAKSKKTGSWKGRMMKYQTFSKRLAGCGLTKKQLSTLWAKYKATGKLPALAGKSAKAATAKKAGVTKRKKLASGRYMYFVNGKIASKAAWEKATKKAAPKKKAPAKKKSTAKKSTAKRKVSQKTKVGQQIQKLRREAGMRKIDLRKPKYDTLAKRRAELKKLKDQLAGKTPKKKSTRKSTAKKTTSRAKRPSGMTQGEKYKMYLDQRRKMSHVQKGKSFTQKEYRAIQKAWKKDQKKIEALCEKTRKSFRTCVREFVRDFYGEYTPATSRLKTIGKSKGGTGKKITGFKMGAKPGQGASIFTKFGAKGGKSELVSFTSGEKRDFFKKAREQGLEQDEIEALWKEATGKSAYAKRKERKQAVESKQKMIAQFMRQGLDEDEAESMYKELVSNPRRMNPFRGGSALSTPFAFVDGLIDQVQDTVASLPLVDVVAPYVKPVGLGLMVAGVHYAGGRYLGPQLQKVEALKGLDKAGYTLVGLSTALVIQLAQRHLDLFESSQADQVAMLAVLTGAFVDGLDYFRGAGQTAVAGVAMSGYGDGGQYFTAPVSQGTQAPLRRHMRQLAAPQQTGYSAVVAPLSGAAGTSQGYGALMYTGAGY